MQTHSPYNRGVALGDGKVFVGTVDGRLIALDMKTGKPAWDTKLVDSKKLTVGFTGAPLVVKDKVIIGSQGGEWTSRGPIFGVDAKTGAEEMGIPHRRRHRGRQEDLGQRILAHRRWRRLDARHATTPRPTPSGGERPTPHRSTTGPARTGRKAGRGRAHNLYTTSVIALDPDTGKLKFYHQELPHDAWDFDSAVGEFLMLDRDGRKLVVHPNKGGFVFVYDRANAKVQNVWRIAKNINFVQGYRPEDRRADRPTRSVARAGELAALPGDCRRHQLERGLLQPEDRPLVQDRPGMVHGRRRGEDHANHRADGAAQHRRQFQARPAAGRPARGHLDARDPVTGDKKWEVDFHEPPLASVLSTGGNLVFVPDSRGVLHAYDAETGTELWSHYNGVGHNGGIISYSAGGKQYIAVTAGWGGMVADDFRRCSANPTRACRRMPARSLCLR